MSLTASANQFLDWMAPKDLDGLCNALAGMKPAERTRFVQAMCDRATSPMKNERGLSDIEKWWNEKVRTGIMLEGRPGEGWLRELPIAELTEDYIAYTKRTGFSDRGNSTAMGRFLFAVMPKLKTSSITVRIDVEGKDGIVRKVKTRPRHYEFPTHDVAQQLWWEYIGLETARANGWPQLKDLKGRI